MNIEWGILALKGFIPMEFLSSGGLDKLEKKY